MVCYVIVTHLFIFDFYFIFVTKNTGLQDYINVINVFFVSTTPVFKDIVNDINSKIAEFKAMDGKTTF